MGRLSIVSSANRAGYCCFTSVTPEFVEMRAERVVSIEHETTFNDYVEWLRAGDTTRSSS